MRSHVLVLEDEACTRTLVANALLREGYDVRVAGDGRQGMALYRIEPADLVVTDIFMPEQEGIETIVALKQCPHPPKIIAMSGGGSVCGMDVLRLATHLGADAVLNKPIDLRLLQGSARRLLDQRAVEMAAALDAGPHALASRAA